MKTTILEEFAEIMSSPTVCIQDSIAQNSISLEYRQRGNNIGSDNLSVLAYAEYCKKEFWKEEVKNDT